MKVGFISDLHIDRNFEVPTSQYLAIIRQTIAEQQLDLLVIGGDISNHFTTTFGFVEELQKQAEIAEARLINVLLSCKVKCNTFNMIDSYL